MSPFILGIVVFIILGFRRGWRREVISLIFVLLACTLIHEQASDAISTFLGQIPSIFTAITQHVAPPPSSPWPSFFSGGWWSLAVFGAVILLGYVIGNRVFPKPATPHEQIIGIIPAVISGAFIFWYLSNYQTKAVIDLSTGVGNNLPLVVVIAILAVVAAVIAARVKKAPAKK